MVMKELDQTTLSFIRDHRVARLATADREGRPSVIPICYAFDGQRVYSVIDHKPKSVGARSLKRIRNIEQNPHVSIVIDDYSDDWTQLRYVVITGDAEISDPGGAPSPERSKAIALLREKYPQYLAIALEERLLIKITTTGIKQWAYTGW